MEAILLAGGLGKRLRTAVPDLPKPMAPVGGRPFLEWQMDYWIDQGIDRFILSIGYLAPVIQSHFGSRYRNAEVTYAIEETPLGTGGGLLAALRLASGKAPVLIANGDTFFEVSLAELLSFHKGNGAEITLALKEVPENSRYSGVAMDERGKIVDFRVERGGTSRLVNGGVYVVAPEALTRVGWDGSALSLEDHLFPTWLSQGKKIFGLGCNGRFLDIGIPEDYRRAEGLFAALTEDNVSRFADALRDNLQRSIQAKQDYLKATAHHDTFAHAVKLIVDAYKRGGRLYIAGNGGSAADAQHLAAEFVSKLARPRAPLPAEALTVDTSILTAIGNDYGYDQVFSRQIAGKMAAKDVFLAITTSGKSPNILKALELCRQMSIPTILLTGPDGGEAKALADIVLFAPGKDTSGVQELHIVMYHTICGCVEAELFPEAQPKARRDVAIEATP